jgi:hypothetical protein
MLKPPSGCASTSSNWRRPKPLLKPLLSRKKRRRKRPQKLRSAPGVRNLPPLLLLLRPLPLLQLLHQELLSNPRPHRLPALPLFNVLLRPPLPARGLLLTHTFHRQFRDPRRLRRNPSFQLLARRHLRQPDLPLPPRRPRRAGPHPHRLPARRAECLCISKGLLNKVDAPARQLPCAPLGNMPDNPEM